MMRVFFLQFFILVSLFRGSNASDIRKPAVAGQFYPANPSELVQTVNYHISKVPPGETAGFPVAFLVPHAGYIYSGNTAAYAYAAMRAKKIHNVILIGNSHHYPLSRGAVFASGSFETPLGLVKVNEPLARRLISESLLFEENASAHAPEHSLEVQLPFLQVILKDFRIVPLLLGAMNLENCAKTADALVKAVKDLGIESETIIIASSDLSHYPSWENAGTADGKVLKAVESLDPVELEKTSSKLMSSSVPNLQCALCGAESVCVTMSAAKALGADSSKILHYENSGDVSGDKTRVVGYGAAVFYKSSARQNTELRKRAGAPQPGTKEKKMADFAVSAKNQTELLRAARLSIDNFLKTKKMPVYKTSDPELLAPAAVFVTLTQNGSLRGCIGTTEPHAPLYEAVSQLAVAAATEDYRFNPVTAAELPRTRIEISVLSPLSRAHSPDDIKEKIHGVVVRRGGRSGLFLPQVWEQIPGKEEFLNELCWQKAGLEPQAWRDPKTELYTFTVFAFEEKE